MRNKIKGQANNRRYQQKLRKDVIERYGGRCICCGEVELVFLAIDHINGGGSKHRREVAGFGSQFYRWLRDNDFPEGFQVLCHNCNFAKRMGACPHKSLP